MAQPYKYNRIDLATDAIRLVRLLRGDEGQLIECEVLETYLHQVEGVPYEALSYVWGTRQSVDVIWLDGCLFEVTENLYEALVHLRRQDTDRLLWIDAICIDQRHNAERGHQVGQMRFVYQNAQRVIVWLGVSNCHTDCLFDWMTVLDQQVLEMSRPHTISTWENQWFRVVWHLRGEPPPDDIREAFSSLLRQDWFSRIWVLQEAALAKSAIITCGVNEVNSRAFVVMPSLLNIDCSEGQQSRLDILPGFLREKSWWGGGSRKDLLTLLQKFGKSKASDPRDIIFALLGISGDAHSSEALRPDYQLSLQEVIQRSVAYLMAQMQELPAQTPTELLPEWSIDIFLDSLHNLPLHVFQWATDNARDLLLYELLMIQKDKLDLERIQQCMSYAGPHGPPITIAMKKANVALIELLVQFPEIDIQAKDSDGKSPLLIAVEQGNLAIAKLILRRRQDDGDDQDSSGCTPLMAATRQGSWALVELLLQKPRVNIFAKSRVGDTPLTTAVNQGNSAIVAQILSHLDVNTYIADSNGDGLLNIAARQGDETIVDLLLQESSHQHMRYGSSNKLTPFALAGGLLRIIKKLLVPQQGALLDVEEPNQRAFVRRILNDQQLVEHWLTKTRKLLGAAVVAGNMGIVSLLLDRGAKVSPRGVDEHVATPLWIAASHGHLDTVKLLIERGFDIGMVANETQIRSTALWAAASKGHKDVAMYLLEAGANVNPAVDDPSWPNLVPGSTTVLWAAVCGGHIEAVRTLAEGGMDLEMLGTWLHTDQATEPEHGGQAWANLIWVAATLGHTDIVSLLIQYGVDFEARDSYYGMTPFWTAAHQNQLGVMRLLIEAGADIRARPVW